MENSNDLPIPDQPPLTLPPKPETAPAAPIPTTLPPVAPAAATPAPAAPVVAPKPVATAPAIAKLPVNPKFVSPMPKIKETGDEIPSFLPVVAGIAAAVTIAFSILIYLKR